ncbi:MAG: sulfatase-like hydrolase/transferase [Bryobacteraceae bacterium]
MAPGGAAADKWGAIKELAVWFSLANLLFVRVWVELLTYTPSNTFFMRQLPQRTHYLAAAAGVLLLGGILGAIALWARSGRSGRRKAVAGVLWGLMLVLAANQLRLAISTAIPALYPWVRQPLLGRIGWGGVALAGAGAMVVLAPAAVRHRRKWISGVTFGVLVAWPLIPLNLGHALWRSLHAPQLAWDGRSPGWSGPVPDATGEAASRVVWVLFDEWDYRLSFEDRPADLAMPELDAVAGESVVARRAYTTSTETSLSVPSLVTGRRVTSLVPLDAEDAEVTVEPGPVKTRLRDLDSVFGDMRRRGIRSAAVGWYLPYCRVWGESLDYCEWQETDSERVMRAGSFALSLRDAFRTFFETGVLSPLGVSLAAERASRTNQRLVSASESVLGDRRYQFVFLHLPTVHPPYYYDRRTGSLSKGNNFVSGYLDHLSLLDKTLGRLVKALRESGEWERTSLLVSSDHSFRSSRVLDGKWDGRVPFLLRVAPAGESAFADFAFSAQLSRKLVADLISGRIRTTQEALAFLRSQSGQPGPGGAEPGRGGG